ncbi:apolipoprotein N-acyltransferase, partial [Bacteroidota bacterium]
QKIKVGLIQPNLNPWKKWEIGNLNTQIDLYLSLSMKAIEEGAGLIVWPESALPVYLLTDSNKDGANRIFNFVDTVGVPVLAGMPDATFYDDKSKAPEDAKPLSKSDSYYTSYNSILLFTPGSRIVQKYGKIKLVPFGEKVPLVEYIPILGDLIKWNVGISSWNTGKEIKVFSIPTAKISNLSKHNLKDTLKIAGLVCIESIYPDFCAEFIQKGAVLIAVVTNDSWYGNSSGPYQHKEFSVLRAIENRKSVVRAANGGISCLINPLGETVAETKLFTRDYLVVEVSIEDHSTFYSNYPLIIPYFSIILTILVILIFIYKRYFLTKCIK